jgi:methyl-accepting chemotaxis protein
LPVTSRDEIGQLTRSFNHMVVELQAKQRIKTPSGSISTRASSARSSGPRTRNPHAGRRTVTVFFSDIEASAAWPSS